MILSNLVFLSRALGSSSCHKSYNFFFIPPSSPLPLITCINNEAILIYLAKDVCFSAAQVKMWNVPNNNERKLLYVVNNKKMKNWSKKVHLTSTIHHHHHLKKKQAKKVTTSGYCTQIKVNRTSLEKLF